MGVINFEDIEPGMILGADVQDHSGRTLLTGGSEVTEKHLKVFKMWGISEVDIKGIEKEEVAVKATANLDPSLLKEAKAQCSELFCRTDLEHPFIKELFRLCTLRIVRHKLGEGNYV